MYKLSYNHPIERDRRAIECKIERADFARVLCRAVMFWGQRHANEDNLRRALEARNCVDYINRGAEFTIDKNKRGFKLQAQERERRVFYHVTVDHLPSLEVAQ